MDYNFLLCVDVRFPGGTSSAVVNELHALAAMFPPGDVAILCIDSPLFSPTAPANAALVEAFSSSPFAVYRFDTGAGVFEAWSPGTATYTGARLRRLHGRYLIVHNPYVGLALPHLAGRLSAEMALIVCHQPYVDSDGVPYYSLADLMAATDEIAAQSRFVPIGAASREGFLASGWPAARLARFDWPNIFDFASSRPRRRKGSAGAEGEPLVIGRHSRQDWVKWPATKEEFKEIYQYGGRRRVRFLGWGQYCRDLFGEDVPANWETLPFNAMAPAAFLDSIDLFVYYHHRNWVEGFGRTIAEAMAAGVPCILPSSFAATFGGAALYAAPAELPALLGRLDTCRDELAEWSRRIREIAATAFGPEGIRELYHQLAAAAGENPRPFAEIEDGIAFGQEQRRRVLDEGFALQRQLGLIPDGGAAALTLVPDTGPATEADACPSRSTDYAIYMDTRSARSDLWRSIELAEALAQAGYEVCVVHVETRSKPDLDRPNPLLDELSPEIEIYGRPGDPKPRYLDIRNAMIVAGPQRLFGESGAPLFATAVRPIAPSILVLLDRRQPQAWYPGAQASLALMCGVEPSWVLVGLSADALRAELPEAVEAPELVAFAANRRSITRRDMLRHVVGRGGVRRGRIGLADPSQWRTDTEGKAVENFGEAPIFAYASNPRIIPEDIASTPHFHVFTPSDISVSRFLEKIDIVTYFPTEKPSDLQAIPLMRAIQAGVLAVVDGDLSRHLGSSALYATPAELPKTLDRLVSNPDQLVRTALTKARELSLAQLDAKAVQAIERLSGAGRARLPMPALMAMAATPAIPEVLFVSSNGVGLGHLTRLMAVARRLERTSPVFVTMSQAFKIVEASGWPVKYLPFHEVSGCDIGQWNRWLHYELEEIIAARPAIRTLVFDGSNPYSGLLAACASTSLRKVWIQRGMWRKGQMSAEHVRRGKNFDLIIEPSDIADSVASEPLASPAFDKVKTDPISLLDHDELMSRSEARAALGIPPDQRCCLLQLGSGTNREIVSLLSTIMPILKQKGITPYIAEWLMGSEIPRVWPGAVYMRVYPLAKYFAAFDFSISAAGYNSFHELVIFGLPTIFIANEHQSMDDQAARAQYAMRRDAAIWMAEEDVHRIGSAIDVVMSEEGRALMVASCAELRPRNGAVQAARIIDMLATEGTAQVQPAMRRGAVAEKAA